MANLNKTDKPKRRWYRPEQRVCPICSSVLKRSHMLWRKQLIFLSGVEMVASWGYRCPNEHCESGSRVFSSREVEGLHLKHRRYSREVVVAIGYRRFWHHQTIYEIHEWLTQDLNLPISERQVMNVLADFLALLSAGQASKVQKCLQGLDDLIIGVDGSQPEKGNRSLYIVREVRLGLTLLAKTLDESSEKTLRQEVFEPLKHLAQTLSLNWKGVISDAQNTIRLAVANTLTGVAHQTCQFHVIRKAGELTFAADRQMKKQLKKAFRQRLARLELRIRALPANDPYRPVLADYADAIRSLLTVGGVAPFELGGLYVFDALVELAASLQRCEKKAHTSFCAAC